MQIGLCAFVSVCVFKIAQEYPGVAFRIVISCANFCGKTVRVERTIFRHPFPDCCHFAFQQCRRGQSGENKSKVVLQHSWKVLPLESGSNVGFILGEEAVTTGFARFKCPRSVFLCAYRKRVYIKNLPEQTHTIRPDFDVDGRFSNHPDSINQARKNHPLRQRTHTQAHVRTLEPSRSLGSDFNRRRHLPTRIAWPGRVEQQKQQQQLPPPLFLLGWKFLACSSTSSRLLVQVHVNNFNSSKDNKDKVRRHK